MEEAEVVDCEQRGGQCQEPFAGNEVLQGWCDECADSKSRQVEGSSEQMDSTRRAGKIGVLPIVSSVGGDGVGGFLVDGVDDGLSDELLQGVSCVEEQGSDAEQIRTEEFMTSGGQFHPKPANETGETGQAKRTG